MDSPVKVRSAEETRRFWERLLLISIGLMVVPPLIGCVGTAVGMVRAFETLSVSGEGDPSVLAGDVSFALITTTCGLVFSAIVGVPMFIVSLVKFLRLQKPA